jgi:hypothetical protein
MGGDERRRMPRASVPLEGEWDGASGHRVGRIADISVGGCFVESVAMPAIGEALALRVTLPGGIVLDVQGVVTYAALGMGFGVRFLDLNDEQQMLLDEAMQRLLG